MSLGLVDVEDSNEDIIEFSSKLCNWLEKLDEGVWSNGKYEFLP